jgi:hypothetical protein
MKISQALKITLALHDLPEILLIYELDEVSAGQKGWGSAFHLVY